MNDAVDSSAHLHCYVTSFHLLVEIVDFDHIKTYLERDEKSFILACRMELLHFETDGLRVEKRTSIDILKVN